MSGGDRARGLEAVEFRHVHIHEDDVVGLAGGGGAGAKFNRLVAIACAVNRIAGAADHQCRDLAVDRIVVGHQDGQRGGAGETARRARDRGGRGGRQMERVKRRADRLEQRHLAQRLEQAGGKQALRIAIAGKRNRRQQDHRHRRTCRRVARGPANRRRQAQAVHFRHLHVQDRQVIARALGQPAQRGRAACNRLGRQPPVG